jgi:hypothetical protein
VTPPDLPRHCAWCGAFLMGGATVHDPTCWIAKVHARTGASVAELERRAAEWVALGECTCRTCGHAETSHVGGYCLECGRAECWS